MPTTPPRRPRRRAVGPPGAHRAEEPRLDVGADDGPRADSRNDDERLRRERPPHHDRGV